MLDDVINTDIAAIEAELDALQPATVEANVRQQPKRAPLPPQFPRTPIHHEPDNSHCQCGCALKRIGEDASEKLDYIPGVFKPVPLTRYLTATVHEWSTFAV